MFPDMLCDQALEEYQPPTREAIEESRIKQLAALQKLRRQILQARRPVKVANSAA